MSSSAEARLRAVYQGYTWVPVTHGMSGATTYRLDGPHRLYVKLALQPDHPDPRSALAAEAERMEWLASVGLGAPELIDAGADDGEQWLVMTEVPGRVASDPWPSGRRVAVIDAVADALRTLHAVPVASCPFDRTNDTVLGSIRRAAADGSVDAAVEDLHEWKRDLDVRSMLVELEAARPEDEDVVVCHGDYCLPNVVLDPETLDVAGLVDLGRLGRADRYVDLALMGGSIANTSLNPQYGPDHAERFLDRYGAGRSDPRLAYYRRRELLT